MGTFFDGWQRKLGLATLLMACLFMSVWVRSFDRDADSIEVFGIDFLSSDGRLDLYEGIWFGVNAPLPTGLLPEPTPPFFTIAYWKVAIPLALFSAWLLVSKPRKTIAKGTPSESALSPTT